MGYEFKTPPYEHQRRVFDQTWNEPYWGFLLDMGTGKTKLTIDTFAAQYEAAMIDTVVIFAPKTVCSVWPNQIKEHLPDRILKDSRIVTWRSGRKKLEEAAFDLLKPHKGLTIFVVNIEAVGILDRLQKLLVSLCKNYRVFCHVDESTCIKNRTSSRGKFARKLARLTVSRRIGTGTPSPKSPTDLWAQCDFLDADALGYDSYFAFRARYVNMRQMVLGNRRIDKEGSPKNTEELARKLDSFCTRIKREDCLDLPPKIYKPPYEVEMSSEQKTAYKDMKEAAMVVIDQQQCTVDMIMAQIIRLQQIACGFVKMDDGTIVELPENRTSEIVDIAERTDEKIIVWCAYRASVERVKAALLKAGYTTNDIAEYHGGIKDTLRDQEEERFQNGNARFMLATPHAGARGRTWTAATVVVYHSNTYDLELRLQSEDRAHRSGQLRSVTYIDLVCKGTVDEVILKALRAKKNLHDVIMESRPRDLFEYAEQD